MDASEGHATRFGCDIRNSNTTIAVTAANFTCIECSKTGRWSSTVELAAADAAADAAAVSFATVARVAITIARTAVIGPNSVYTVYVCQPASAGKRFTIVT